VDEEGKHTEIKCPVCGVSIGEGQIGHTIRCDWKPTREELAAIDRRDPDMIPALCYNKKAEAWAPEFDKNLKKCSGKDRGMRKFLSKISY
jgi:hypothetical protein